MSFIAGLIIAGVFGAIFGSYSTLFAYRIPLGESCFGRYFGKKSRCPSCNTIIRTRELIPLINWLFTLGKCTTCKVKIPRTHLFIEIATTLLFMLCYIKFSFGEEFILFALLCATLVVGVAIDFNHKKLPNQILITVLILGFVNRVLVDESILGAIFSAAIGVAMAAIFYQIFDKKFKNLITNHEQSFGYAKFIIIASVCLQPEIFLLYFLSLLTILILLITLDKSLKGENSILGICLILPFVWLMLYPSF